MDDAIRHLRCAYRSLGDDRSEAAAAAARINAIACTELADRYGAALHAVMGAGPDVYILRHVHTTTAITSFASFTDTALAEVLARRMAVSVASTIQHDAGDGANLVRFSSEAELVAQFAAAIADGNAWTRWYFFPFRAMRDLPAPAAIRTALLDHRAILPLVLAALRRNDALERVCSVASPELDALWTRGIRRDQATTPDSFRPLFAAATTLIDRLGLWAGARPSSADLERLFEAYLQTAPEPAPWTDRLGLAMVVLEIVRFLAARRAIHVVYDGGRVESGSAAALHDLDWLDAEHLAANLSRVFSAAPCLRAPSLARELTPRQQRIAAELLQALAAERSALDGANQAGAANCLRLLAALVDRLASSADDAFARAAVESLLLAWAWLARGDRDVVVDLLRRGRVDDAIAEGPAGDTDAARAVRLVVRMFGDRGAADVLSTLLDRSPIDRGGRPDAAAIPGTLDRSYTSESIPTRCAGVFLLSRAVLDAHVPALVAAAAEAAQHDSPTLDMTLAALALRWGGAEAITGGDVDNGVRIFAGLPAPTPLEALRERWAAVSEPALDALQEATFATLAGLHAISRGALHIHEVRFDSTRTAIVAGAGSGDLWPLAAIVDRRSRAAIVRRWVDVWTEALGQPPEVVVGDPSLRETLAGVGLDAVLVSRGEDDVPDDTSAHALSRAFDSISAGQLGLPATDLTVATMAMSLLRVWARWLGHFADSTAPYLLDRFIRRHGYIDVDDSGLVVTLDARPLDMVLEMAGYTDAMASVPWLADRRLRFARAAAP